MIVLGLTGSVGMGKSTAAAAFRDAGVPVWDADAAVHRLYGPGAAGTAVISAIVPDAVGAGGVDRAVLRAALLAHPPLLPRVEAAIHPLAAADRADFLARARASGAPLAVCDVPLLFETGADSSCDTVLVVSAPPEIQRARVLARPGMTEAALAAILARQMPDAEKRARADRVIDTSRGIPAMTAEIHDLIAALTGQTVTHG